MIAQILLCLVHHVADPVFRSHQSYLFLRRKRPVLLGHFLLSISDGLALLPFLAEIFLLSHLFLPSVGISRFGTRRLLLVRGIDRSSHPGGLLVGPRIYL